MSRMLEPPDKASWLILQSALIHWSCHYSESDTEISMSRILSSKYAKKIKLHINVVDKDQVPYRFLQFFSVPVYSIWLFMASYLMHIKVILKTKFVIV